MSAALRIPSSCAPGPASPPRSTPAPSTPAVDTSRRRDRGGCAGSWWRPPPTTAAAIPTSASSNPVSLVDGLEIARLALARRLLTLCFYALRDPEGCAAYPLVTA
jgi:hypothetical protein